MGKKFLSAVLCAALAASIVPCAAVEASAAGNSDYGLAQKTSLTQCLRLKEQQRILILHLHT